MKKLICIIGAIVICNLYAHPCPPPRHCPPPYHDSWGRGGCHFWSGFLGGVVGGAMTTAIVSQPKTVVVQRPVVVQPTVVQQPVVVQPTVVQQPVVQQQVVVEPVVVKQQVKVWVEGRYVEQVQANGNILRVWHPGHYEYR